MRALIGTLLVLLFASPSLASDQWGKSCRHVQADAVAAPSDPTTIIGAGEHAAGLPRIACFGWGTTNTTSQVIQIRADSALFTFIDDVDGTSATATAMVEKCPCDVSVTRNGNTCIDILDAVLDGTQGGDTTQNAAVRVGPGCFRVVGVAGASGDFPFVYVEAEE